MKSLTCSLYYLLSIASASALIPQAAKFHNILPTHATSTNVSAADLLNQYGLTNDVTGATTFALLYGGPLLSYNLSFEGSYGLEQLGINKLYNQSTYATAETQEVVHPNADTLYNLAILDTSQSDIIVSLPAMEPDRAYVLAFWDPYGSEFATIGSLTGDQPGDYLLSTVPGQGSYATTPCQGYQGCLPNPGYNGILLVRVEVKNNSTDLDYCNQWVSNITFTATGTVNSSQAPISPAIFEGLSMDNYTAALQLTARLSGGNTPWNASLTDAVADILTQAGISNGSYTQPAGVDMSSAEATYNTMFNNVPNLNGTYQTENNGWSIITPSVQGIFTNGTDFLTRAYFGTVAYIDNTADVALYPMPTTNEFTLMPNQSIRVVFSGPPPMKSSGFWSVTAYDEKEFLFPNPQNVYAVGDRSNITYPDGQLVYADYMTAESNVSAPQGGQTFEILVQGYDNPPPANWTANWLPVPDNGTLFTLTFRLYGATEDLLDASYIYPVIQTNQPAVLSGNATMPVQASGSTKLSSGPVIISFSMMALCWTSSI